LKQIGALKRAPEPAVRFILHSCAWRGGTIAYSALSATSRTRQGGRVGNIIRPVTSVALINAAFTEPFATSVDPNGRFEFPSVFPGTYQLHALPQIDAHAAATVAVTDKDITQLAITAPPITYRGC
jgi:hypothetical protein